MDINPLSDVKANMFSILWVVILFCWFRLLYGSFFLISCAPIWSFFLLFPLPGEIYPIKCCYDQFLRFVTYVFSKIFMVSGVTFKLLIHFEFILVCGVRMWSTLIFLHISVQFSQHHLLNKLFLVHCIWLCPLLNIDCKHVGFFWALYSVPLVYVSVFNASTMLFD